MKYLKEEGNMGKVAIVFDSVHAAIVLVLKSTFGSCDAFIFHQYVTINAFHGFRGGGES